MANINLIEINETTSTNDYLKEITTANNLPEWSVVVAQYQNKGRGQGNNIWESEYGKNLLFSTLLNPHFIDTEHMFMISKVISLGIVDYLNSLGEKFTIKWPNDIYYNNNKLGGILIENSLLGNKLSSSMVGIGININQKEFVSNAPNPISLSNIFHQQYKLSECFNGIISNISIWYNNLKNGDVDVINKTYLSHLYRNSNYHKYKTEQEEFSAKVINVESDGRLVLKTDDDKIKNFYFKEVEFVL